jgi:hypothetical protein
MIERYREGDDEFVDLLVVYDEQLTASRAPADHRPSPIRDISLDLMDRLEGAKKCSRLRAEVWPQPSGESTTLMGKTADSAIGAQLREAAQPWFAADKPELANLTVSLVRQICPSPSTVPTFQGFPKQSFAGRFNELLSAYE